MAPGRKLPRELALPRMQPALEQLEQLYAGVWLLLGWVGVGWEGSERHQRAEGLATLMLLLAVMLSALCSVKPFCSCCKLQLRYYKPQPDAAGVVLSAPYPLHSCLQSHHQLDIHWVDPIWALDAYWVPASNV
jgi:hypothetical protein